MGRALILTLVAALAVASPVPDAVAQTMPQVGIPGCTDDVPVRATRELVSYQSRGRSIRAYLYSPTGEENGRGIVLLHGGTGFEMNSILFDAHAIQLASRGYWVMLPAYFDAAEPDAARRVAASRAWTQAALDAREGLGAIEGVGPQNVTLWGYSRGAGVAADAATVADGTVRTAVLAAGGGDIEGSVAGRGLSVLLLHARRDESVPVRSTRALAEDLRQAGAAVQVQELNFDGHQYDLPTWCDAFARTRAFIESGPRA